MADWTCTECRADPTTAPGRYCAPRRCYCRHESCPATPRTPLAEPPADVIYLPTRKARPTRPDVWGQREEGSSWIDKL